MSTEAIARTLHAGQFDLNVYPRPRFSRLVTVEWRKLVDTRAGRVLLIITGGLTVLAFGLVLLVIGLNDNETISWGNFSGGMLIPVSLLLPVLAVSSVTAEWSQRTALTTFTLEPHRGRVMLAKFVSVTVLAALTIVVAFALGTLGTLLATGVGGYDNTADLWNDMTARALIVTVVQQFLYFFMAFGIGMLFLSTAGGISVYYVAGMMLPIMVYSTLVSFFDWARDLIPWIDMQYAMSPLISDTTLWGDDLTPTFTVWAQSVVSLIIWVVLPLTLGSIRVLRSEVK